MQNSLKLQIRHALGVAIAFTPWAASMFALYWLEYGQIWTTATPHRGKTSIAVLILGMGFSFFLYSRLINRK